MRMLCLTFTFFLFALAAFANDSERQSNAQLSPESSFRKEDEPKPISSTQYRLKSAADHLHYGAGSGAANTVLGPALMIKAGFKGSKYAAQKVKEHWKGGSYHKAAGQAVMVAARPATSLVSAPAAMFTGLGTAAVGTARAAGSVLKLAKDASARPFRAKEDPDQKNARQIQNAKNLEKKLLRKAGQYQYPLDVEEKAYKAISKDPYGFIF